MVFGGLLTQSIAFALPNAGTGSFLPPPGQQSAAPEKLTMTSQYPVLTSALGTSFTYSIDMQYSGGKEPRVFDLEVTVPTGWNYSIAPSYGQGTEIAAIRLDPTKTYPDSISVTVRPYTFAVPPPGEYPITVQAVSDSLQASIDLKAVISASYSLDLESTSGLLNTNASAGKDNYFTVSLINTGSADLEKIHFSSNIMGKPAGWSITFTPDTIDTLPAGGSREVRVDIKPAEKTIAGDYMVTISAEPDSKYAFAHTDVRVTVLTPTIWGWLGVAIVVIVVVGLVVMFMRLGRR
jgi:uncharacterized membrane protein